MTPNQTLFYNALAALKEYQKKHKDNLVIKGANTLGEDYTRILCETGYLEPVIKGWYIPSAPENSGTSAAWYASYWSFISSYLISRFDENWSLSAELSLQLYGGITVIPKQIIVRAPRGNNNILQLPFGCSIIDTKAEIPDNTVIHEETQMRIYPVEDALFLAQQDIYIKDPTSMTVCLSLFKDESSLVRRVVDGPEIGRTRIGRVIGALRAIGNTSVANRIQQTLRGFGYTITETNPFTETVHMPLSSTSPYAARIEVMWEKMKRALLSFENLPQPAHELIPDEILASIEANYVNDGYNSLSIEGYQVSEELLERVRTGNWDPKENEEDKKQKNALAARGYYQAYQAVISSITDILEGMPPADVFSRDYREWHFQLFEPSVRAGLIKAIDLAGFRNHNVYIKNSLHVPVGPHAVVDCMDRFETLMKSEEDPLVRAVLGHFFFTYIHPYMDGNGRTARFIMNTQLTTAGYQWLVINEKERQAYMDCLEQSSLSGTIDAFGKFIIERLTLAENERDKSQKH